mmetsp:Transcript_4821/g.9661  ORF Transcript_4821/g.9661 Transcript_4821/m.9661 type:complete len:92 (+) Transcript_4821:162-437(+)
MNEKYHEGDGQKKKARMNPKCALSKEAGRVGRELEEHRGKKEKTMKLRDQTGAERDTVILFYPVLPSCFSSVGEDGSGDAKKRGKAKRVRE